MKRIVLLVPIIVVVVLAFLAYQSLLMSGGSEKSVVRIGTLRGGISSLDIMRELGLDERHGFKLEVVLFSKTLDLANALARGDIDVAVIPAEFVAKLREQGTDVVIVAVDFYQNQAVVVRSGVEAESLEDLYGRRLGVFKPTGTYAMFRAYMKALYDADPEEVFELASMPPPQLVESFQRGDLDAVVIWEPFVSKLVKEYGGRIVVDYTTLWRRWGGPGGSGVMIVYAARGEWARENPELVEKLQKARAGAAREWNNNRELAVRVLQEVYGLTSEAAEYCWERVRMEEAEKLDGSLVENIVAVWRLARQGGYIAGVPKDLARGAFYGAGG